MNTIAHVKLPEANPEVYLNMMRVVASKEFGSIRPIAFRSGEGNSTVVSVDDSAYTTTDALIVTLADALYEGAPFDGVITATLSNKSVYTLKDLVFDGNVEVVEDGPLMTLESKGDFTVYFRWGKGIHTAQDNAEYLATQISSLDRRGMVYFTSNHGIVNNMTFECKDGVYEVSLDTKDGTSIQDVLNKTKDVVNQINFVM